MGSTDRPLPGNPLQGIQFLVERRSASGHQLGQNEHLTVDEAFSALTTTPAWAARREHDLGSLTPGKRADFTVLATDPWTVNPSHIGDITVEGTFDGQLRWAR